ncbi:hypothetical protein [Methylobacterium platani]|uniref:Uncharacterized protein n=2 Tax=Methylobacterium platani TaxID=427683 RepID=A0A179S8V2_9HYPH|nr:hypothetical protein [Methylobacterium platani]KMO20634.1 hypothetical protein SQ03_05220 [Methylobacterium platani JCM 14648]OAS22215.1 hypothetical protein A5481_19805 [Methylobacterium platani]
MLHVPGMPEGVHVSFSPEHLPVSSPAQPERYTPLALVGAGTPSKELTALLDAHEMAYGYALYTEAYGLPDLSERRQAEEEAFRALLHTPLQSDADRAAYAAAVISRQMHSLGDGVISGRDHPLAVAYRNIRLGEHAREPEAMRHVGRKAERVEDPILAAIDAHRAAYAAWHLLMLAWSDTLAGTPEYEAAETIGATARLRERDAFRAILTTRPTTPAGFAALASYLPDVMRQSNPDTEAEALAALDALRAGVMSLRLEAASADPVATAEARSKTDNVDLARLSAEQIDLSALDVFQLSGLFEAYQVARFSWEGVEQRPYSFERGTDRLRHLTDLGKIARFEEERASWIMHRLEQEIVSRKPEDEEQRDEILMVRTQQEFRCNARIHDNALLVDIARDWTV